MSVREALSVPSLAFEQNQAIRRRCNPAEFESATGCRKDSANVLSRARLLTGLLQVALPLDGAGAPIAYGLAGGKMGYTRDQHRGAA